MTYADGSGSAHRLSVPGRRHGTLATKAVALPHVNTPEGQLTEHPRLYVVTVPLAPGREWLRYGCRAHPACMCSRCRCGPRPWAGAGVGQRRPPASWPWGRGVVRSCGRAVVGSWGRGVVEMFNGVLDFDGVVRDPARDERRRAGYDSGGQLHPGDAGLAALAESVDLTLL